MNKLQVVVTKINQRLGRVVFVPKDENSNRFINYENRYEGNDFDITVEGDNIVIMLTGHKETFTDIGAAVDSIFDLYEDYGLPKGVDPVEELLQILAKQIKMARVSLNLTQDDLAAKAGLSRVLIGQIERGDTNVTVGSLVAIAGALNMNLDITFAK
jgi:putative transcriptional regulator